MNNRNKFSFHYPAITISLNKFATNLDELVLGILDFEVVHDEEGLAILRGVSCSICIGITCSLD